MTTTIADSSLRFKSLEAANERTLDGSQFHIMRLDGRAFSTYTRGLGVPFDDGFAAAMDAACAGVAQELGASLAYVASDEISLVLTGSGPNNDLMFGGNVDKLLTLAASYVSAHFNQTMFARQGLLATFDARVVSVEGASDVQEYLAWRQGDTYRNAVSMAAQAMFSHRELLGVPTREARARVEARTGEPLAATYSPTFLFGRQVRRTQTLRSFTFVHTRTGEPGQVEALRSSWPAAQAPQYRKMGAAAVADLLAGGGENPTD